MDQLDNYFLKLDEKLADLNKKITILQDLVLYMKSEFELIVRNKVENECFSELTIITEENMNHFLDERPPNCELLDECTTLIEKRVLKILRVFLKNGSKPAADLINSYMENLNSNLEKIKCPNDLCMKNAIKILKTLEKFISSSVEISAKYKKNLFSLKSDFDLIEGREKEECNLLSPLSNEIRLKILKNLSKGGLYYTQLERLVGLKGGHFHFHLDKLIEAGYVMQDQQKGPYLITTKGLRALKFLYELTQEMFVVS